MTAAVGIIANPASGKDIRRLVAHGSVFDNNEKINIVRRVLRALDAVGVRRVLAMPDSFNLVAQAQEKAGGAMPVEWVPLKPANSASDSTKAAQFMAAAGAGCIVTLGGDGTNRAVAKGCGYVPLVPISTGTNNAFPEMVEGTLAGLAAAAVALRVKGVRLAGIRLARRLDILRDGELTDFALVDVVVYNERFVASRAIWDVDKIKTVILSRVAPGTIGASAIAGYLPQGSTPNHHGIWLEIGGQGRPVLAPIAPGIVIPVPIEAMHPLAVGQQRAIIHAPAVLALDGEREILIKPGQQVEIRLSQNGPHVVNVKAALQAASQAGLFMAPHKLEGGDHTPQF